MAPWTRAWSQAAPWPARPIKLIVPFPAGGGSDPVARMLAQGLSERLGQPVVVDNRAGGQGTIGTAAASKSEPDGYTLLLFVGALVADAWLMTSPPFDPLKDFTFISQITSQPTVAVTGPHVPAANLAEFIAYARAKPGGVSFGYGSPSGLLTGAMMSQISGAKLLPVPYKGAAPIMTDLVGGSIDLAFASPPSSIPLIKAGKLKGLAVVGSNRMAGMPELATAAESGLPEFAVDAWHALAGPPKMPAELVARINVEVRQILQSSSALKVLKTGGMEAKAGSAQDIARLVATDYHRWGDIVKAGGIKPE